SFEKVFDLDHEAFTQRIILEDTDVHRVLKERDADSPRKVAQVIDKTHEDQLVGSMISSQIDADRMDYLLRDAYYTGVSYGQFDMERILRVMRPTEDSVVIKHSGMHAVEDYIMSRYQMYWQVYFHPVTRSAEVILTKIFHRAKHLFEQGFDFQFEPTLLKTLFQDELAIDDYLQLDESVIYYYFSRWQQEKDALLSDLCSRFMNRNLYKYVEIDPKKEKEYYHALCNLFEKAGIPPEYYVVIDSSADLLYDVYRSGEGRVPIYLQMPSGEEEELSTSSVIVDAITGKERQDHKLYYPEDLLQQVEDEALKEEIKNLLHTSRR